MLWPLWDIISGYRDENLMFVPITNHYASLGVKNTYTGPMNLPFRRPDSVIDPGLYEIQVSIMLIV